MRKLFTILAVLSLVTCAMAAPDSVPLVINNITTLTSTVTRATSVPLYGYIVAVELMVEGASFTGDVSLVVLTNANFGLEQTIYSNGSMTAGSKIYPRVPVHDISGVAIAAPTNAQERVYVVGHKLELRGDNASFTNKRVRATVLLDR